MSNYLIYVLGPLFPNQLWTLIEMHCRHLQDHVRSSYEVGSALGLGQGPWALPGGAAQHLSPCRPHLWRFEAARKEPVHQGDGPESLTHTLAVRLWASDVHRDHAVYLVELAWGSSNVLRAWHTIIIFPWPFHSAIHSNKGLNYLISKNPFRSNFLKISSQHKWDPAFGSIDFRVAMES